MNAPRAGNPLGRRLAIVASIVVLCTVVASLLTIGSPSAQRQLKLDERRVSDLANLRDAINSHVEESGTLPAGLAVLATQPGVRLAVADPVSATPYEFIATGPRTYRLCAHFATDSAAQSSGTPAARRPSWAHGIGRHCFNQRAARRNQR